MAVFPTIPSGSKKKNPPKKSVPIAKPGKKTAPKGKPGGKPGVGRNLADAMMRGC